MLGLFIVNVPVLAPTVNAVVAPAKLIVVATVLNKSTDVLVGIMVGFLIVKVPVSAPTVNAVVAPAKLIVVAFVFNKFTGVVV